MLMPKRVKRRKQQKGRMKGLAHRGSDVSFGRYALQATEGGVLLENKEVDEPGPDVLRPNGRGREEERQQEREAR